VSERRKVERLIKKKVMILIFLRVMPRCLLH